MVKKVVFWGATGQAKVLRELIGYFDYQLVALFDSNPKLQPPFPDVPLYHGVEEFNKWQEDCAKGDESFLVAIGGSKGADRIEIHQFLEAHRLQPMIAIHPTAFVAANVHLGSGCQVMAHASVCTEVSTGEECIINTAAIVDHESVLGKGVHIGPGATLAGSVSVGDYSFIGARAVVLPRVNVGANVVVGAGSVVTRDVPDGMVTFGNPVRMMHPLNPRALVEQR